VGYLLGISIGTLGGGYGGGVAGAELDRRKD